MTNGYAAALGELLERAKEPVIVDPTAEYTELTVKLWGKGIIPRGKVLGSELGTNRFFARAGQIVLSKIDARHGAIGIVPVELDGAITSNDFPAYNVRDPSRLSTGYLRWLTKSVNFVKLCRVASEGTTNRVRIKERRFFAQKIPLPPLAEQQAIVARLDALADKTRQLTAHLDAIDAASDQLLARRFHQATQRATYRPMVEVAPLVRRQVDIDLEVSYPELGVRSFGKGTFHKPALAGIDAGTKRLFRIEAGDLVFSNVFAWEGAIAIAGPDDAGRYGSHRFMTCVVDANVAEAEFLRYYLLSPEGLDKVREASPGGAGRNRTLGVKKLEAIEVPAPTLETQRAFVDLYAQTQAIKARHANIRTSNADLLPATLDCLFGGSACSIA